jgi:hypothetical protein
METKEYRVQVICPSVDDFAKHYPQYAPFANSTGKNIFSLITKPESFMRLAIATDLGFAAVNGVAKLCSMQMEKSGRVLDNFTKQFIGAVVCCMMECNNFKKTGKKKSIHHADFSKGEVYHRNINNFGKSENI